MVLLQKLVPSQKIDAELVLVLRNACGELGEMSMSNQAVSGRKESGAAVPK